MKKTKYITFFYIMILCLIFSNINVYAETSGFWEDAYNWFEAGSPDSEMKSAVGGLVSDISDYIEIGGTVIIFIATVVLGIRYMFASAEGKSAAKETTMNLLVACVLFFGWANIKNLLYNESTLDFVYNSDSFASAAAMVLSVFKFLAQVAALVAVLYFGIKFIFSGAEGRADIKSKSVPFIIGIILAFCAVEVLTAISNIVNEL